MQEDGHANALIDEASSLKLILEGVGSGERLVECLMDVEVFPGL